MKKKLKVMVYSDSNNKNNLTQAIHQVESYICKLNPENYQDIKLATKHLSKAAIGAYLSVHSVTETLDFIDQLAHSMVDDVSENIVFPADYSHRLH